MGFDQYRERKAKGLGSFRMAADLSLAVLLVLFLVVLAKQSAAEALDVPLKLLVAVTALFLLVRAPSWRDS